VKADSPEEHDPFFFLSRKAAKPQRKTAKRLCGFAREVFFPWNNSGITVFSQRQPLFISPP
jgi:hypothetical protein